MNTLANTINLRLRPLACFLLEGPALPVMLTALALIVYVGGFRAAGFSWYDAIGAGSTHVFPGALLGVSAWKLQPRLRHIPFKPIVHILLAAATAGAWFALVMAITAVAKPDEFGAIASNAWASVTASGTILYTAIAMNHALRTTHRLANERAAAAARAELAALRSRVEPHFLFNALETVAALVRSDRRGAERAIETVGRMLRRALDQAADGDDPDAPVAVSDEMALVRDYLSIETLRMGDRLRIVERVDVDATDLGLPAFTIQSLVENAIKHGLSPAEGGGELSVTVSREDGSLVIVVADDGVGAEEAAVLKSRRGLKIVRDRLDIHFGAAARFDVATAPGRGLSVRIEIPAREVE